MRIVIQYALRHAINLSEVFLCHQKKKKKNAETFVIAPLRNPEEVEIIKCQKPSDLKKVNPSL